MWFYNISPKLDNNGYRYTPNIMTGITDQHAKYFILIFPYPFLLRVFQIKFLVERHLQSPYAIAKGNPPNKMRLLAVCLMLIHIAVSQPPDYYWPSVPVLLSQSPPVDKSVLTRETLRLSSLLDKNLKEQKILGETSAAARKEHKNNCSLLTHKAM